MTRSARPLAPTLALALLPALAFAQEDYAQGLVAELERGDAKAALEHYARAQAKESRYAREATLRKIELYARLGDEAALRQEITYLATFPGRISSGLAALKGLSQAKETRGKGSGWEREYQQLLASRVVTLNFRETPLRDCLDFIRDITGLNVVAAPGVKLERKVTLQLQQAKLADALRDVLGPDLATSSAAHCLVVHTKGKAPALPRPSIRAIAENGPLYRRLLAQRLTIDFDATPIQDALGFLRDLSGQNLVLHGPTKQKAEPPPTVDLRVKDLSLLEALQLIALDAGLQVELASGVVHVGEDLSRLSGPDPFGKPRTRFDAAIAGRLDAQRLTLNFPAGTPFADALEFFADISGLSFFPLGIDTKATFQLRVKDVPFADALRLIAADLGFTIRYFGGILVLTPRDRQLPERLKRREIKNKETGEVLRTRKIKLSFEARPLAEVVDFMRDITGVRIRFADGVDTTKTCTLRFKDAVCEDVLALLLDSHGLRYGIDEQGVVIEKR